ncbi:hypothetical protein ES332_A11G184600v1 [Gossypium tomentosum]|uniref:Uncharacterized protein n=1 Tax=Gossypium tomentosum TaxID=34277 RepID=A0A5D2NCS6_GOSTO|nr:hypothetical protein ES332_A11G184600v1 [Gossypium tomentosum]TYI01191.1 hypothetical protein ES332_A11G184600v1 [Gossypium tomentosum]TYI01192.1 hypothetical protein ES332_A11G184600v1 [Gossypium tomentosum]TYI01193.1 hypothetical protein ES332_A11G184600v1 [Gossypium tomentosum]TYI01194.1 hypothetical protein ES332_A11G184600v1 [Gossypium tomentosum]
MVVQHEKEKEDKNVRGEGHKLSNYEFEFSIPNEVECMSDVSGVSFAVIHLQGWILFTLESLLCELLKEYDISLGQLEGFVW